MVNPGKVLKARKSKRQPLKMKHKIERKCREHQRKVRRDAKRNPQKHRKRDPGIPNSWPFKQKLLAEQEARREREVEERAALKAARKEEQKAQRKAEAEMDQQVKLASRERRNQRRQAAAFAPLHRVLADSDVVRSINRPKPPLARSVPARFS